MKTTANILLLTVFCAVNTLPARAAEDQPCDDPCPYAEEYPADKASTPQKQGRRYVLEKQVAYESHAAQEERITSSE